MSTDAIVMLKDEHKQILRTFRDFENAGDGALKTKQRLVDKIIELLTVHTYIENEVMYPRVRELVPDLEDDVLESYEEHHVADLLVMELATMKSSDERFTAKATVLIENVRHHIEEEESEWFPQVREALGRKRRIIGRLRKGQVQLGGAAAQCAGRLEIGANQIANERWRHDIAEIHERAPARQPRHRRARQGAFEVAAELVERMRPSVRLVGDDPGAGEVLGEAVPAALDLGVVVAQDPGAAGRHVVDGVAEHARPALHLDQRLLDERDAGFQRPVAERRHVGHGLAVPVSENVPAGPDPGPGQPVGGEPDGGVRVVADLLHSDGNEAGRAVRHGVHHLL